MSTLDADAVKACCGTSYGGEIATFLLGEHFHPGGDAITRALLGRLGPTPGSVLVDVACGRGTSALIAAEQGYEVIGVDLSEQNVVLAEAAVAAAAVQPRPRFVRGDAEHLPLPDRCADAILCECALCLFPDKPRAVHEFVRVLRPGGRLALSDVVADPERLPPDLQGLAAWASCVADARPLDVVVDLLTGAGFEIAETARHDAAMADLLDRIEARLRLARLVAGSQPRVAEIAPRGLALVTAARDAMRDGALGYASVIARRPA